MTQALTLILWFLANMNWHAQPCLPEGIIFTRQGQVDSFNIRNPGCDQVSGNLEIRGMAITKLDSLYRIKSIGGFLYFNGTTGLKNLLGLSGLQSIGTALYITNTKQLSTLNGLNALSTIGGELYIFQNDSLKDISALGPVSFSSSASLTISNNPKLAVCALPSICQFLSLTGRMIIQNNAPGCNSKFQVYKACNPAAVCPPGNVTLDSQQDIQDFILNYPNCSQLTGSLYIDSYVDTVYSLLPLIKITSVAGNLFIRDNPVLQNLSGLDSLRRVNADFYIQVNRRLKNLVFRVIRE